MPVRAVAVIPARGGSKGVPGKNLRTVGGVPLVVRAVRACLAASSVEEVVVSTDDDAIALAAAAAGARIVRRPGALAGDTASSESALLHVLDSLDADPDVLLFVQCTSPFVLAADLDAAVELVGSGGADSAFAAVSTYEFLWRRVGGQAVGINHEASYRPRRQEREPHHRETGAFYAMATTGFREAKMRFFGRTAVVEVAELTALEIDTPLELAMADALAPLVDRLTGPPAPGPGPLEITVEVTVDVAVDVDAVVTDFDGVHTDDAAYVGAEGVEQVRVSRSDGLGVAALRDAGYPLLILSTERHPVVSARAAKLGVEVLQGVDDKATALKRWLADRGLDPARVAYLGNDVNDLAPMAVVGWPTAVADARPEVRAAARLVLRQRGGHGAVRELCDRVLEAARAREPEPAAGGPTPPASGTA